ncbi:recombinase family protein [Bartonella sp. DGB2]|uniref:recombinase family protein n=1 Tax=Bartonella sp. DGB2 TaxID=3388426 RepID=UPI00398FFCB0
MGGSVPLGYRVEARQLVIKPDEAALVQEIFVRFVRLKSVTALLDWLNRAGYRTKIRIGKTGIKTGGRPFDRQTLYRILSNRLYLG